MKSITFKMALFTVLVCCISLLSGITHARHTTRGSRFGIVGTPVFSFDPLSMLTSGSSAGSSASSSASGLSSSASSSAGSSRSLSVSSANGLRPRQQPTRRIQNGARRIPLIARIGGRPMLILRSGGSPARHHTGTRPSTSRLVQRTLQQPQRVRVNNRAGGHGAAFLNVLGLSPNVVTAQRGATLGTQPPGVSFLGNPRITSVLGGSLYPIRYIPLAHHGMPKVKKAPVSATKPVKVAPTSPLNGVVSKIGSSGLEIVSGTRKGEIVIRGPGGSIVIGQELLTGISKASALGLPFFSEFEEVEAEGVKGGLGGKTPNSLRLTDPGKGSILIKGNPNTRTGTGSVTTSSVGNGNPSLAASSVASSAASALGSASAAASASASTGGVASAASSSAGSSASSSVGSREPVVVVGNGIMAEKANGGQVITLGKNGGRTQVITMGGTHGQLHVADGGIQAPGNATFIVGG